MMNKCLQYLIVMLMNTSVFANSPEFEAGIKEARNIAPQLQKQAQANMSSFNPRAVFEHYNPNPAQKKYYGGEEQSQVETMQSDAMHSIEANEPAKAIITSMQTRPQFTPNTQSPDIQRALLIQSEADNIVRGVTSQYIDCQSKQSCETKYVSTMCTQSSGNQTQVCRKNLVVSALHPPAIQESWTTSCDYLEKLRDQGVCHINEADKCISGEATKIINGVPVSRACWAKQSTYACGSTPTVNNCAELPKQGCEQTGSTCQYKIGDVCLAYQQTYRCPQQLCVNTANIICGDGKDYCLNGDCTDHQYQKSQDFGKALTRLSATNEAVKNFDTVSIFKGRPKECRDDAGNFSNCCQGGGWGQDAHLAHCSNEEKALGKSREKSIAVYVGRYCSSKILGKCIEHKETYCVFGSKIARVIQEQGRRGQLHINFGDAKHANCNGITPDQLQRIDLARIDFGKEIMDELGSKLNNPNLNEIQKLINQRVQQHQRTGQSND